MWYYSKIIGFHLVVSVVTLLEQKEGCENVFVSKECGSIIWPLYPLYLSERWGIYYDIWYSHKS